MTATALAAKTETLVFRKCRAWVVASRIPCVDSYSVCPALVANHATPGGPPLALTSDLSTEHLHTTPSASNGHHVLCVYTPAGHHVEPSRAGPLPGSPARRPSAPSAACLGSSSAGAPEGNPVAGTSPAAAAGSGSPLSAAGAPAGAAALMEIGASALHPAWHNRTQRYGTRF